jgi:hypothetical protein
MSLQPGLSRAILGAATVWLFVVCLLLLNRTMGLSPMWTMLGALVAAIVSSVVLPAHIVSRTNMGRWNSRPRVRSYGSWRTPLEPSAVVQRTEAAFKDDARTRRVDATTLEIAVGCDVDFRRWGVFTARGRAALPAVVTVSVVVDRDGARVSARARDDFGWYAGRLGKRVEDAARKTLRHLIARVREASPPAPNPPGTEV